MSKQISLRGPGGDHQVATFISKLWGILSQQDYAHLISWSEKGSTFVVKDVGKFSRDVLPHYFKHSNFNSFVRQLNLYGFRKMARPEYGSLSKTMAEDSMEFWHTHFSHTQRGNLHLIHRRVSPKGSDGEEEKSPHRLSAVISDIHQMKGRQDGIASVLEVLKQDNSHLRHELVLLKDKHIRQQNILNKIIHFLVHMVYKGKIPSTRRSSRPSRSGGGNRLMLTDFETGPSQTKKLRMGTGDSMDALSFDLPSPSVDFASYPLLSDLPSPNMDMPGFFPASPTEPTSTIAIPPVTTAASISSLSPSTPATDYYVASPDSITSPLSNPLSNPPQATPTKTAPPPSPSKDSSADLRSLLEAGTQDLRYPRIPDTLLDETFPIPPAPSNLLPLPHPENRMCVHGQLHHQQLGLDNLPEFLSGQLSLDPSVVSNFVSDQGIELPDYDYGDTARLLESLTSSDDPNSFVNLGALVPVQDPFLLSDSPLQTETTVLESSNN